MTDDLCPRSCSDHDVRARDTSTPYWRESHHPILGEMIAVWCCDGTVGSTMWDCVGFYDGGRYGCDGSDAGWRRQPLPETAFWPRMAWPQYGGGRGGMLFDEADV